MADTIDFIAGANTISIRTPDFGYSVAIHMPIYTAEVHPQGYSFFDVDSSGASDYRILTANFLLTKAEKLALNDFFRDAEKGRCENITMRLGVNPSGFFPFGPDLGDIGDFTVRLLEQKQGGATYSPLIYFRDELKFILVSAPAYMPGTALSEGPFQIGAVTGLMPPQTDISPESNYNYLNTLTRTGVPYSIDGLMQDDEYTTSWEQYANDINMGSLIEELRITSRISELNIVSGNNYYLFGNDKGSQATYVCNFLGSARDKKEMKINVVHERFNRWKSTLIFWFNGVVGLQFQDTDGATSKFQDTDGATFKYQDSF